MAQAMSGRGEPITGINVTPLVDVVLVLLIVLMVTAGYIASQSIPVELPKAESGESQNRTVAIGIDRQGILYVDAQQVPPERFRSQLEGIHAQDPGARAVIAADGSVPHQKVISVIDSLRQVGIVRFAIQVQPEDAAGNHP